MANKHSNMIYAIKDGEIISITDVERGLKCGCTCPACGEPLIAKKGQIMMHHFAHTSGNCCEYGYETSLHLAAKDILLHTKRLFLPAVYVHFKGGHKESELLSPEKEIVVDHVELEKRCDNIIPDVVVYSGNKKLFVEIYVTHSVDKQKYKKIKNANVSTLEIDLSKKDNSITYEELEEILIKNHPEKYWIYNVYSEKTFLRFMDVAERIPQVYHGLALHAQTCPISQRVWNNTPYANIIDDCLYCKFCVQIDEDSVFCTGKAQISSVADFNIPEEERMKRLPKKHINIEHELIAEGTCPKCGNELIKRKGRNGYFLGCSSYPMCTFTASIDK